MLWPQKGSLMKAQTQILHNRLYYTKKIELHRKSRTVRITPRSLSVRRVHYGEMGKAPTTLYLFICVYSFGFSHRSSYTKDLKNGT